MKKIALIAILAAAVAMPVFAADPAAKAPAEKEMAEKMAKMKDLATKKNCMACHAVDKKLVGPAYKEVAAKYKDQKDAGAKLAEKIQKGGVGAWGQIPMPANPQVNPEEAKQLANWVLSLK
jgi:cytochrome c